ncbi:cobaltochelatase subunit CobN [Prochlorococcus marinus]|uniref:cobaltochelatase subunit CobN n=1 Tax=Prochlorococcus marinus TaxID=1219 RepID=UPI0022B4E1A7|nr:cobaltochelatase subunit CobN [Prochlorococcus marinus]
MHRISTLPGNEPQEENTFIEQPSAPVIFLTSATSDITCLSTVLKLPDNNNWKNKIRALPIAYLSSNSSIDHYITNTCKTAEIILVRFLGSRSYWSYGFEQLGLWQLEKPNRHLIVVSGIESTANDVQEISSLNQEKVDLFQTLLNQGGIKNYNYMLQTLEKIIDVEEINLNTDLIEYHHELIKWKWKNNGNPSIAVFLYKSLLQSGNTELADKINDISNKYNLNAKIIWITSFKSKNIENQIISLLEKENIKAILTTTSFSSVEYKHDDVKKNLWDRLDIPVYQLLISSSSITEWKESTVGLNPIDLSIQVVLPEVDGRICTIPVAFKNLTYTDNELSIAVYKTEPYEKHIEWCIKYIKNLIYLQQTNNSNKKIALVIANYPVKDSRIANGVGLDTPESLLNILNWLKDEGYNLGNEDIPDNSKELINLLLSHRTNSEETNSNEPQSYLNIQDYLNYWKELESNVKEKISNRWGNPLDSFQLEKSGFPINGITFGNITILIQSNRGYESDNLSDLHSPDLPPTHKYIAQYCWLYNTFKANAVVHLGKHGSLEWLPGKGVGLGHNCFPFILCPPIPNIYPFIVNDPGEGSQAKRRTHAIIIDHLTPPLSHAGSFNDLLIIENLIDEYYESKLINDNRNELLEKKILDLLIKNSWPGIESNKLKAEKDKLIIQDLIDNAESYLCEIKNSQIRTGLHVFGVNQSIDKLLELTLTISNVPTGNILGLTQGLAEDLGFTLDPWSDEESKNLNQVDIDLFKDYTEINARKVGKVVDWLNEIGKYIIEFHCFKILNYKNKSKKKVKLYSKILNYLDHEKPNIFINHLLNNILPKLLNSSANEKTNFLEALDGKRISSGPSGAPTRGKLEVLPTGKNFFSVDIRAIPTETAWDLGKRSAEQIMELYLQENGEHLSHLAISIWGTSTMRNGGEDICQLFALMGLRPIWDGTLRRVVDVEVIPLSVLNRPRVDVTLRISGLFRDAFPQIIELIRRGQNLIGNLKESSSNNPLAESYRNGNTKSRIYGSAPGSYGAGLQEIINSGSWENQSELADAFIEWSKWRYEGSSKIIKDKDGLESNLSKVKVVLHSQDNREHDILDSDDYYQFQGGLISAIKKTAGTNPQAYFADNSRYQRPRIHKLSKEIDKVVRSRLLNPKWIKGIKDHGYKGAFEMSASLDYLFSYDATTNLVPNWCYQSIVNNWLMNNNTKNFISENNPWALRDIAERLLEASNRKLWTNASIEEISSIKKLLSDIDSKIENYTSINDL